MKECEKKKEVSESKDKKQKINESLWENKVKGKSNNKKKMSTPKTKHHMDQRQNKTNEDRVQDIQATKKERKGGHIHRNGVPDG